MKSYKDFIHEISATEEKKMITRVLGKGWEKKYGKHPDKTDIDTAVIKGDFVVRDRGTVLGRLKKGEWSWNEMTSVVQESKFSLTSDNGQTVTIDPKAFAADVKQTMEDDGLKNARKANAYIDSDFKYLSGEDKAAAMGAVKKELLKLYKK